MNTHYPDDFLFKPLAEDGVRYLTGDSAADFCNDEAAYGVAMVIPQHVLIVDWDDYEHTPEPRLMPGLFGHTKSGGYRLAFRIPPDYLHTPYLVDQQGHAHRKVELKSATRGRYIRVPPTPGYAFSKDYTPEFWSHLPDFPYLEECRETAHSVDTGVEFGIVPPEICFAALRALPVADFQDYNAWRDVCFAIHAASGGAEQARDIFVQWSQQDAQHGDVAGEVRNMWSHTGKYNGRSITGNYLLKLLNFHGAKREADIVAMYLSPQVTTLSQSDVEAMVEEPAAPPSTGPEFPENVWNLMPHPIGDLFDGCMRIPLHPTPVLVSSVFMPMLAYLLDGAFVTGHKRLPQFVHLGLSRSTGGKDSNTAAVVRAVVQAMKYETEQVNLIEGFTKLDKMLDGVNTTISSDIAFLQAVHATYEEDGVEDGHMFWLNTEATNVFAKIVEGGRGNSNVEALADKLKEVYEGGSIGGKVKAAKKESVPPVRQPNVQVVLLTQADTVLPRITSDMVHGGLLGRQALFIDTEVRPPRSFFCVGELNGLTADRAEFLRFVHSLACAVRLRKPFHPIRVPLGERMRTKLHEWYGARVREVDETHGGNLGHLLEREQINIEKMATVCAVYQWAFDQWDKLGAPAVWDIERELPQELPPADMDISGFIKFTEYQWAARMWLANEAPGQDRAVDLWVDELVRRVVQRVDTNTKNARVRDGAATVQGQEGTFYRWSSLASQVERAMRQTTKWRNILSNIPQSIQREGLRRQALAALRDRAQVLEVVEDGERVVRVGRS